MKKICGLVLWCLMMSSATVFTADATNAADVDVKDHMWEMYTYEKDIRCLLLSDDGLTLWLGGRDGLEEKDAGTGRRTRFYPHMVVECLLDDGDGGLWIGTRAGLVHFKADGARETFDAGNSELPGDVVTHLVHDEAGGLWVATEKGVVHMKSDGVWDVFTTTNSEAPRDSASALLGDGDGGVWIGWNYIPGVGLMGAGGVAPPGLSHLKSDGSWALFDVDNSGLPSNNVKALLGDGDGGLWIGMRARLARLKSDGSWECYDAGASALPPGDVTGLVGDGRGGIWANTSKGLVHLKSQGPWDVYNMSNSVTPANRLSGFASDGAGGIWVAKTRERVIHFTFDGISEVFQNKDVRLYLGKYPTLYTIADDGAGGLWILMDNRLSRLELDGFFHDQSGIFPDTPSMSVISIVSDGIDGVYARTSEGLARARPDGPGELVHTEYTDAPHMYGWYITGDEAGGCWIVILSLIAHLKSDGSWDVHADSPYFPRSERWVDGADGLWFPDYSGYPGVSFVHLTSGSGAELFPWESYDSHTDDMNHVIHDGSGGLWIGSSTMGLSHLKPEGIWENFNRDTSELPSNFVTRVLRDGAAGGVWAGTNNGLSHLTSGGAWEIFNTENSELPDNYIQQLVSDGDGGLWAMAVSEAAYDPWSARVSGLAHLKSDGAWEIFDTIFMESSDKDWVTISSDGVGGLWMKSYSCLARLSFNIKEKIVRNITDESAKAEILEGSRAAVIIAAGGAPRVNPLSYTAERLGALVYKTFWERGYDHSEIHYVSPKSWADFNADGFNDFIVDAPVDARAFDEGADERVLIIDDVRGAFEWATSKGSLTQPLYVYLVGNGPTGRLMLSPTEALTGAELGAMLDAYQTATKNKVVVIIESCRSGALIPVLSGPDRVIAASSGAAEFSYYDQTGMISFTAAFLEPLGRGETLKASLFAADRTMKTAYGVVDVSPLMDVNGDGVVNFLDDFSPAGQTGLNGIWRTGRDAIVIEPATDSMTVYSGASAALEASVAATGPVKEVLAVVRQPYPRIGSDDFGARVMNNPVYILTDPDGDGVYSGATEKLSRAGEYFVTYIARDYKNHSSRPVGMALMVEHSPSSPAWFTIEDNLNFTLPCVRANRGSFEAFFESHVVPADPRGLYWKVKNETIRETVNTDCIDMAPNLALPLRHADYTGYLYSFTLDFYLNPSDPDSTNLYWQMNWSTLVWEEPGVD